MVLGVLTSDDLDESVTFDVPTTVARFGNSLYLPNARFGTVTNPETAEVVCLLEICAESTTNTDSVGI